MKMSSYIEKQIEESYETERQAFSALMKLIAPANQDEAIKLYVKATHSEFWRGWYSRRQDELEEKAAEAIA